MIAPNLSKFAGMQWEKETALMFLEDWAGTEMSQCMVDDTELRVKGK